MAGIEVIAWTWRDGSVHLEVRGVTMQDEATGEMVCHLRGERFHSACGLPFFGRLSSTGLRASESIDCEECRALLIGKTFIESGRPDHNAHPGRQV